LAKTAKAAAMSVLIATPLLSLELVFCLYSVILLAAASPGKEETKDCTYASSDGHGPVWIFMHDLVDGLDSGDGLVPDMPGQFLAFVYERSNILLGFRFVACVFCLFIHVICLFVNFLPADPSPAIRPC
jgi:hypothetical protein